MLIRRTTRASLVAAFAALVSCARNAAAPAVTQGDASAACAPRDTASLGPDPWDVTIGGHLRPLLDSLDMQVETATLERLPALLLARGRAKAEFEISASATDSAYAKSRPDEYFYNEVGGDWLYNGKDFRDLIRRFPKSSLVEDAAYELTRLGVGGECEDSVACFIAVQWGPVADFLRDHPGARQAGYAVKRALEAFREADAVVDLRVARHGDEPSAIRGMVAALDTVARLQTPPRSTPLLVRAAELWERYAEYERSRAAYTAALATADAPMRRCIAARLAALPARHFRLDTTRVFHPRRVALRWAPPGVDGAIEIYRSTARAEAGAVVARVPMNQRSWTDTTAGPGATYWYRLVVDAPGGRVQSNPASAETPTLEVDIRGMAVSTTDQQLYLFGFLPNGYPQVLRVSGDGASVERRDGMIVGVAPGGRFDPDATSVWLVDAGGVGVLQFHKTGAEWPRAFFSALRRGGEYLRLDSAQEADDFIASVDEPRAAAWIELRGRIVSMDCVGATSVCWNGREADALLRDATGAVVTTVSLPDAASGENEFAMAVFAAPHDSSAWLWLNRSARLLHVSRTGAPIGELRIGNPANAYAPAFTVDRDRQTLWFTRPEPEPADCGVRRPCRMQLAQLDMRAAKPEPRVIAHDMPVGARLAPDLSGGVWVLADQQLRRIDASGRTRVTVALNDR